MGNYGYLHLGRVLSRDATRNAYNLESVGLARTAKWPPVPSCVPDLQPGDRVILGAKGTSRDDLVILAKLQQAGFDLGAWLETFTGGMTAADPYRHPTPQESALGVVGLQRLALPGSDAETPLQSLGFTVVTGTDSVTGRAFALAYSESDTDRAWGAYLFDLSAPLRLTIQAPHPVADAETELMALEHWRSTPGALLLVAGAHRLAGGVQGDGYGLADVAHRTESLFHQVAASYAEGRVAAVQWHGFADASAPGLDQVVSPGSGNVGPGTLRIAANLERSGFAVGVAWDSSGSGTGLIALENAQGDDAVLRGAGWTHVENSATVRQDPELRAAAVAAVVAAGPEFATGVPMLAEPASGQYPLDVGSVNTVGDSPYAAHANHRHAERQATLDRITAEETATAAQAVVNADQAVTNANADARLYALEVNPHRADRDLYSDVVSTMPREDAVNGIALTNGTLYLVRMYGRPALTLSAIRLATTVVGAGGTTSVALFVGSATTALSRVRLSTLTLTTLGRLTYTFSGSYSSAANSHLVVALLPTGYTTAPQLAGRTGIGHSTLINPSASLFTHVTRAETVMPTDVNLTDGTWTSALTSKPWVALG